MQSGNFQFDILYPGALSPYFKTFVAPFLPTRLTAPGSPRMKQQQTSTITKNGKFDDFTSENLTNLTTEDGSDGESVAVEG